MEPECSLPHSQVPATCPYSELDPGHTPTFHFLNIHLNIILPAILYILCEFFLSIDAYFIPVKTDCLQPPFLF